MPRHRILCGQTCADLATDATQCGGCGTACASGVRLHGACACDDDSDCPGGCDGGARQQGGAICNEGSTDERCGVDDDCPLGSGCLALTVCPPVGPCAVIKRCSKPCGA